MPPLRTMTWDEPKAVSDVLKYELASEFCHDVGIIASGSGVLEIGTLIGQITRGSAGSADKSGGNTGNGTFVLDNTTPLLPGAKVGIYTLRCVAAAANAGTFRLVDPDGFVLGDYTIAGGSGGTVTVQNDIKGVLTDGGTDFEVGDGFDITVAAGSKKWVKYVHGAVESGDDLGILLAKVDATAADRQTVVLARGPAVLSRLGILWDASVDSDAKKAQAIALLAKKNIIVRDSA